MIWWIVSFAIIVVSIFSVLAILSLFCFNGPYVRDTYASGSILASFWGARALHEDVVRAALATDDKTVGLTKKESAEENVAVANAGDSNTQTMFNSNVPLNQQLCQAIDVDKKAEVYEGGEEALTTERNIQTDRGMITENNAAGNDESKDIESMNKIKKEVQLKLKLEDLVDVNPRYQTIFEGLKLNTAHNSAVMQPLAFMLRRILYAALIVFIPHLPQVATIALISACVLMLAFSVNERQWKDVEMQNLAVANEAFFYTLLVLVLAASCMTKTDSMQSSILGWTMIAVVTLAIFVNLTVMMVNAWNHSKLLYTRYQNKQAHLAKKHRIAPTLELSNVAKNKPAIVAIPEVIEEVSSNNEESLGIVGLPQPDQPKLLNPAELEQKPTDKPEQKLSVVHPAKEPRIEEEHFEQQKEQSAAISDIVNPEELQVKDKSAANFSSIVKEICEESPQEKSSEDGDKFLDLEKEVQKIEQSINKSVRSETKQQQPQQQNSVMTP